MTPAASRPRGAPEIVRDPEALGTLLLFAVFALAGWAWGGVLSLALTGEDWTILARVRDGGEVAPHLFRPWLDPLLGGLHAFFGVDSPVPYHAASLLLHGANVMLVAALVRGLGLGSLAAVAGAALFALAPGATDTLAWVAAINRPLSTLGALIALNGAARLGTTSRRPWILIAVGFLVQLGANEEAYGTALLLVGVLLLRRRELPRGPVLGFGLAILAALAAHGGLLQPEGSKLSAPDPTPSSVLASFTTRSSLTVAGLSLPGWSGSILPLLAASALVLVRRSVPALFLLAWWAVTFVPFVLSDPHPYRAYPTLAATGALFGAGVFAVLERVGARRPRTRLGAGILVVVVAFAAGHGPRGERLDRWQRATSEIEGCLEALARVPGPPSPAPRLVNLESSTLGLFGYRFGVDPATLANDGFLDTPTGWVQPPVVDEGPWFGRRCEGSFGWIEPDTYFAARPEVPSVSLLGRIVFAESMEEALSMLREGRIDVDVAGVVERGLAPEGLADLRPAAEPGAITVTSPLTPGEGNRASMRVEVRTPAPVVLALRLPELYRSVWRLAPDNAIFNGLGEATRGLELTARRADSDETFPAFPLDAYGLGVLLPAGTMELELAIELTAVTDLR